MDRLSLSRAPFLIIIAGLVANFPARPQSPRSSFEAFEVATIKPMGPDDVKAGRYIRMQSAHRFQIRNYTTYRLIAAAYDLNPKMISGGPAWAQSDVFEILAATPGDLRPTNDDQMRMLRSLLADRFGLTFHRAKKDFSIYELTLATGGPKFQPTSKTADEPNNVTSTLYPAASGGIDHALMPARNVTMTQLASVLQRAILDRPVVDHTGLAERYDFDLEWTPDESQFDGNLPSGAPDSPKPGLFAALDHLGLRIQATRAPIDTLVIDNLNRPSEN